MNPLRMFGNVCQIHRYQVDIVIQVAENTMEESLYFVSEEKANAAAQRYGAEVIQLDTSGYEWLDGLEFDTREDAIKAYEMGEEAYLAQKNQPSDHELLMALLGGPSNAMGAAQNLGNVLQVMAAQLSTSEP